MVRVVAAQLRHRVGRSVALLLGILIAVTSFTVLTGTTEVSRLRVVGSVEENFRSAYDILVRPAGSTTELEDERDLVRNNFLSGLPGGISTSEYEAIKAIPGIDVAAPIAVLGYQSQNVFTTLPLAPYLDPALPRQVFRVRTSLTTDRGLSHIPGEVGYVYRTSNLMSDEERPSSQLPGGSYFQPYERLPSGDRVDVCPEAVNAAGPFDRSVVRFDCFSADDTRTWTNTAEHPEGEAFVSLPISYVIAAIDPMEEARLAGLDAAVVEGRYLRSSDQPEPESIPGASANFVGLYRVPFLMASDLAMDEQLEVVVERLPSEATTEMLAGLDATALAARLATAPGIEVGRHTIGSSEIHDHLIQRAEEIEPGSGQLFPLQSRWSTGPVDYEAQADRLRPRPVDVPDDEWSTGDFNFIEQESVPWSAEDNAYRRPHLHDKQPAMRYEDPVPDVGIKVVGTFDPSLLPAWSELSALPMETYSPPGVVGWDDRSRGLLGNEGLQPTSSPAGYLASPPLMLTTLSSLDLLMDPDHYSGVEPDRPISAVRVRVAGVTGPDPESRERVRVAAEEITERTDLDVDITIGSSPTPLRVDLQAGRFGRPELSLREEWVQKGVAVAILDAFDRKSMVLFGLILVVCGLLIANAAAAAVRTRRTELGVLACVGWSSRALYGAIIGEVLVVGLVAGVVAGVLAPLVASPFDIDLPATRAWIPVAAAVVLAVLAGFWPASRAARSDPAAAVRPAVLSVRGAKQPQGIVGFAATNLLRVPGRTLLGALSLAVGVCALTVLLAANLAFRNVLVGSLLGDAISIQIRGVDYVAVAAMLTLGVFAVGDVLYLNVRERAAEFAALQATGWSGRHLAQLVLWEGALMGLLGSVVGAALGLVGAAVLADQVTAGLGATAAVAVLCGVALAALAAAIPARLPSRLPIALLLAEE